MSAEHIEPYFGFPAFDVGEKVVCVDDRFNPERLMSIIANGMTIPVEGEVYTIREFVMQSNGSGVLLEEIVNAWQPFWGRLCEPMFFAFRFRSLPALEIAQSSSKEKEQELVAV